LFQYWNDEHDYWSKETITRIFEGEPGNFEVLRVNSDIFTSSLELPEVPSQISGRSTFSQILGQSQISGSRQCFLNENLILISGEVKLTEVSDLDGLE
jgi:hypothetical protein